MAFLIFFAGWPTMMVRQWLFRMRAEALLADIKSLDANRGSWADAQRFMNRWGSWGNSRNFKLRTVDWQNLVQSLFLELDGA